MVVDNNEKKKFFDPHSFDGNYTITTFCLWVLYAYCWKDYFLNHDCIFKCWPQHVLLSLLTQPMYRDMSQKILHHIQIMISYLSCGGRVHSRVLCKNSLWSLICNHLICDFIWIGLCFKLLVFAPYCPVFAYEFFKMNSFDQDQFPHVQLFKRVWFIVNRLSVLIWPKSGG